jgi:bifunctional DNA-binding transcriptional regulator/antitoxin component of YhaV-PrlF toxin-antitoxin module
MAELFRLKIAAKRQLTVPQRLLDVLHLNEGDELQITVVNGQIAFTQPCKSVPTSLLSPDVLAKIEEREKQLMAGEGIPLENALAEVATQKAPVSLAGVR